MIDKDKFWKAIHKEVSDLDIKKDMAKTEIEKAYYIGAIESLKSIWNVFNEAGLFDKDFAR